VMELIFVFVLFVSVCLPNIHELYQPCQA